MNKTELVTAIAAETGLSKKDAEAAFRIRARYSLSDSVHSKLARERLEQLVILRPERLSRSRQQQFQSSRLVRLLRTLLIQSLRSQQRRSNYTSALSK